jgi:hypothetical protein
VCPPERSFSTVNLSGGLAYLVACPVIAIASMIAEVLGLPTQTENVSIMPMIRTTRRAVWLDNERTSIAGPILTSSVLASSYRPRRCASSPKLYLQAISALAPKICATPSTRRWCAPGA